VFHGFPLLYGDPRHVFENPYSAVITEKAAKKYFGRTNVLGENLTIENFSGGKNDFRITGVLAKPFHNSVTWLNGEFDNQLFLSNAVLSYFGRNMAWQNSFIVNYVELQKGIGPEALKAPIAHLLKVNTPPSINDNLEVSAVPLADYYMTTDGGTVQKMLYTLSYIAFFILLMAIINFVNMSVSRSGSRMKEIGIRKVLGSLRRQLMLQFLTESIMLTGMATLLALVLYWLAAPWFSAVLGKEIPPLSALPGLAWILIPLFALLLGTVAGLYPAFMLSSMPSVDSLKGNKASVRENIGLRKGLVSFQFAMATIVLVGAIIVSQQISLFFSDRLGYDKEYMLSAQLPRDWSPKGVQRMATIRNEFTALPQVKDVSLSYERPDGNNIGNIGIFPASGDSAHAVVSQLMVCDEHYADTYKIPLAGGAFFNQPGTGNVQDSDRVVINETAAKAMGWKEPVQAIGQPVKILGIGSATGRIFTISGVVKDFHFKGMGESIDPGTFAHVSQINMYRFLSFKLRPGNIGVAMNELQKKWAALLPGAPFEYQFMDETLQGLYKGELQLKKAASTATILAMIIVLTGVVGLLSLSVQKRTREIAIRKVIGASVPGIIRLFIREFLPLLLLAGLIASPLAYLIMHRWLNDYVTRITITPWPFIAATGSLCVVMVLLIVTQTIKAALANPVKSLKTE